MNGKIEVGFNTVNHVHPCLIFAGKARTLPVELTLVNGSSLVGSALHATRVGVTDSGKSSSLRRYGNIYDSNIFMAQATCVNVAKLDFFVMDAAAK